MIEGLSCHRHTAKNCVVALAGSSHVWTASDVERSLWSAAASQRKPSKPSAAAGEKQAAAGKRKAADQGSEAVKERKK